MLCFVLCSSLGMRDKSTHLLTGTKQIFVNSTKDFSLEDTVLFPGIFLNKESDELTEGFQLFTFDFDKNTVEHNFWKYYGDSIVDTTVNLIIKQISVNENFAIFIFEDKSMYYNTLKEKYFILNLKNNPNYPKLQILWKEPGGLKGAYAVDTRDFNGLFTDSKEDIFEL